MLPDPVVRLLLREKHLVAVQARGQQRNTLLAGFIAAGFGKQRPEVGLGQIDRSAASRPVVSAKRSLCRNISLLRRQRKPVKGLPEILRHILAAVVTNSHTKLSRS